MPLSSSAWRSSMGRTVPGPRGVGKQACGRRVARSHPSEYPPGVSSPPQTPPTGVPNAAPRRRSLKPALLFGLALLFSCCRIPQTFRGSDKTPIGVHRQFSSIELLSHKGGRCSPPSSLEYAPIGAQSKQEGGCVGGACACGWGTTPTPPACAAIAQSPFCPTHSKAPSLGTARKSRVRCALGRMWHDGPCLDGSLEAKAGGVSVEDRLPILARLPAGQALARPGSPVGINRIGMKGRNSGRTGT